MMMISKKKMKKKRKGKTEKYFHVLSVMSHV